VKVTKKEKEKGRKGNAKNETKTALITPRKWLR
jgi:hypothetical protein